MWKVLVYSGLAASIVGGALVEPGLRVPGAARTDLWNSLWSFWYFQRAILNGELPWRTEIMGHPKGGVLMVADPLNAIFMSGFVPLLGLALAYTLLVGAHVFFSGWAAHALGKRLWGGEGAGFIAGVSFAVAPVLVSGIHNGTSEAIPGGWLALAVLGAVTLADAKPDATFRQWAPAGLALGVCTAAGFYTGICAWVFWAVIAAFSPKSARAFASALPLALAIAAPVAILQHLGASDPENLVGIKNELELDTVRRSVGPADLRTFFIPGDFRSPDFRVISRYAQEYIHCDYLGWTLILAAFAGLRRRPELAVAGALCAVLSLGPVLVKDGQAWILDGALVVPMPYYWLERLPGFSSLSLLYRLGVGASLALSLLAGAAATTPRRAAVVAVLAALELRLAAPVRGLPDSSDAVVEEPIRWLAEAPEGAVMNFPVVGGRDYLFEQTVHGKPVAGSLNFPNNSSSRAVWAVMLDGQDLDPAEFARKVGQMAKKRGIRYLVVHVDPMARPDMHDDAVRKLKASLTPAAEGEGVKVYALW